MNKNNLLLKNPIIIQFYRFIKVLFYKFFYGTSFYKLKYSANTKNFLDSNTKYLLVTCHNGGGGTVTYLKNKYKNKSHVIILRNAKTADKDYLYSLENADSKRIIFIKPKDIKFLENSLNAIHVLSLESYMSLNFLLKWFASLSLPITYDLHDFHCIWYEAHFIHNEKYLLEDEVKKSVLHYAFKKITFEDLHSVWNNFFPYVHKINAFSQSSKEIFSHYFPSFENKVKVTPHSLSYLKCGKLSKIPKKFCLGIFGIIRGVDKGSNVVRSFLEFSKNKPYEIYVNGELNPKCIVNAKNIHYMGHYDVNYLDKIIIEQGISVSFFPSICPETFSYTVSELIYTNLPIACFDLGAQAEKVKAYKFGEIIKGFDNLSILEALKKAHQKGISEND